MSDVAAHVGRAARWLTEVYSLDLAIDVPGFVVSSEWAKLYRGEDGPRTGLLIRESPGALDLALYVDPLDANDHGTILEETSHLICVAWHAAQGLPVSGLILELQAEVDRFLLGRLSGNDPFAHFDNFQWASWLDDASRGRYETAHRRAHRYCRKLASRFPNRVDTPALRSELCNFYRSSPEAKLRQAA